uniref:Putative secreted protein n=1 Tax=Panstrongylus lignarius TaxID=156445 RepID=A0A224XQN3_9HEMI
MKIQLLVVLLFCGVSLASHGQGIDEEKVEPDCEETELVSIENYVSENNALSDEWNSMFIHYQELKEIVIELNKGVDKVLHFIREAFGSLGEVGIPLPDMNKQIGHPPYGGTIKVTNGYFKNPATIERTGDVKILVRNSTTITLQVQLGLEVVELGFGNYHLDVLNIHQHGKISATVEKNSITFRLTFSYAPVCSFHLDELKFDKLSGIKINITGLGVFQLLFNELSTWLESNFESTIQHVINKKLYETANKAVKNKDICRYFPH